MEQFLMGALSLLKTVFLFSLVIGFVALIHELGHFLAAKWCDVRVDAFAIGMGKRLWWRKHGETEYSLRLFPVGGYVLLAQEDGEDGSEDAGERSFARKNLWQKIFILLAGPFMNVLGTVCILLLILGILGQPSTTMQISMVQAESPALQAGMKVGDIVVSVGGEQVRRFQDGRFLIATHKGQNVEVVVRRGKEFMQVPQAQAHPAWFLENFKDGQILEIGYVDREGLSFLDKKDSVIAFLKAEAGARLRLRLATGSEQVSLNVVPSPSGTIGIGIRPYIIDGDIVVLPLFDAFKEATVTTFEMSVQLLEQIGQMLLNIVQKFQGPKDLGGPVAIANAVSQYADDGIRSFLMLVAQICLCIGVFNLVPIPGLDGGRILVLVVKDWVNWFGRAVLKRAEDTFHDVAEGWINVFGVFCVFTLVILVTIKDIGDLVR